MDESVRKIETTFAYDCAPPYYSNRNRREILLHTRLRHACSSLNGDMYRANIVDDPSCSSGAAYENTFHLLCKNYCSSRNKLISKLNCNLDLNTLLNGSVNLNSEENHYVFRYQDSAKSMHN